jgi:hypothetical protein
MPGSLKIREESKQEWKIACLRPTAGFGLYLGLGLGLGEFGFGLGLARPKHRASAAQGPSVGHAGTALGLIC